MKVDGATLLARNLDQQGVQYMFGVVGFPVTSVAEAAQREGITYIGMRNEQAASYAAQAASYLAGRPQACLTISGPGMVHAIAGLANAQANCWPMLLIAGASGTYQDGMGAFQEAPQLIAATPFSKYARRIEQAGQIPQYVEQAVRASLYGRPGPAYLEVPDDVIRAEIEDDDVELAHVVPEPPAAQAIEADVARALRLLQSAESPLVIIGKGMAWARAEAEVREFIECRQLPFLATPMGKGVVPDKHPLSVAAARTFALGKADVVLLLGARLNWQLHFGLPPRFRRDVRFIRVDVSSETGRNQPEELALIGDGKAVMRQFNGMAPWQHPTESLWRRSLDENASENTRRVEAMMADENSPLNYYRALRDIRDALPDSAIVVSEGANTMDVSRSVLLHSTPRSRLDAGSFGTMGVGPGFAIAAAVVCAGRRVVAVEGDSAFGFSGMEVEVACRYNLPITFVVLNNGGIGFAPNVGRTTGQKPPRMLDRDARYERIIEAFGGDGFHVERPQQLPPALRAALDIDGPSLINVVIDPRSGRKPQEYHWHTI